MTNLQALSAKLGTTEGGDQSVGTVDSPMTHHGLEVQIRPGTPRIALPSQHHHRYISGHNQTLCPSAANIQAYPTIGWSDIDSQTTVSIHCAGP